MVYGDVDDQQNKRINTEVAVQLGNLDEMTHQEYTDIEIAASKEPNTIIDQKSKQTSEEGGDDDDEDFNQQYL